nr:hypothetical protein CFP56_28073 [Quercus suber]
MSQEGMCGRRRCRLPEGDDQIDWRDKNVGHIQVWNSRAQLLCHEARLEGDMSPAHPYFHWYDRVANHKQMLTCYAVGSPEYKQITAILRVVDHLHRITAQLPLEDTNGPNPKAPKDTG